MKIHVSVIIPAYNAESTIGATLDSVVSQKFPVQQLEIIVVDDGSTDDTAHIVKSDFPFVHLIRTENQGPSHARNIGTQASSGEFIQYLDADDLLAPGKLRRQLETLEKTGADVAYGDWQKLARTPKGKYIKGEEVKRKLRNPEIDLLTDFWCPPAVYLFRHSIVERVGGWNEDLLVVEDVRFLLDCVFQGATFAYCEGIMAYFRVHPSGESLSSRDPIVFPRCCLRNAIEVEKWWQEHGGINQERRQALLKVYGYVARASFERDRPTFETAYQALERLSPGYIPETPTHLRLASQLLGYRRAEALALWYRQGKLLLARFWKAQHIR